MNQMNREMFPREGVEERRTAEKKRVWSADDVFSPESIKKLLSAKCKTCKKRLDECYCMDECYVSEA
jgi:hypothetical protein